MCKQSVGKLIRYFRLQNKLTQEQLAFLLDTDRQNISAIERGVKNITLNYLNEIITKLEKTDSDFFNLQNIA